MQEIILKQKKTQILFKQQFQAYNYRFGDGYYTIHKLGQGTFGSVHKTFNIKTFNYSATKFESKYRTIKGLLKREATILSQLKGKEGFPQIISYGTDENYNYLVMDLLGMNLEDLRRMCGGKFTNHTVLRIGLQLLKSTQKLHEVGILHRDFKPENFAINLQNPTQIVTLDFGLSISYKNVENIHPNSNRDMVGTAQYTSCSSHLGKEQGRKDDLESLGYVLIFLAVGELPWKKVTIPIKELRNQKIMQSKISISIEDLCLGAPKVFKGYFKYVRKLNSTDKPDYKYLMDLFQKAYNILEDYSKQPYDWEYLPELIKQRESVKRIPNNAKFIQEQYYNINIKPHTKRRSYNFSSESPQKNSLNNQLLSSFKNNLSQQSRLIISNDNLECDNLHITSFEFPAIKIPNLITHFKP